MQKHTLCCSVVFLQAMLKKDSKLKVFSAVIVCRRSDLQSRQKSICCVSILEIFPAFAFTLVCVGDGKNRRNATWEGHILTRNCCVPNGSKKVLFKTHHESFFPSLAIATPNATRYRSRMYSALLSFLPIRSCCSNSTT